jgi:hypothetical protein
MYRAIDKNFRFNDFVCGPPLILVECCTKFPAPSISSRLRRNLRAARGAQSANKSLRHLSALLMFRMNRKQVQDVSTPMLQNVSEAPQPFLQHKMDDVTLDRLSALLRFGCSVQLACKEVYNQCCLTHHVHSPFDVALLGDFDCIVARFGG